MTVFNDILIIFIKSVALAACAPLVSGIIRKAKNKLRMRKGPGILQPYYNLRKYLLKDEVVSGNASWIFSAAPAVYLAGSLCALILAVSLRASMVAGETFAVLIALFFVLSLGRFFLALSGLDTGSSFGGMGSSREAFISGLSEPAAFTAVFALCMGKPGVFSLSGSLAALALAGVALAETSRIPVDNQETHLELTMVHEAMILEYSGRSLALIEFSSHLRQIVFFTLLWLYFFPANGFSFLGLAAFSSGIAAISLGVAFIEVSLAKMRLFRVMDFLSFLLFIALLAAVAAAAGL